MPTKTNKAPFGCGTERFIDVISWVPAPGAYDPKPIPCTFKNAPSAIAPWRREHDSQEYSKNLGYRFPHVLKERTFLKSLGGPGTTDINDALFKRQSSNAKENVSFGISDRFKILDYSCAPPPGTYNLAATKWCHRQDCKPSFEWDGFQKRDISCETPWTKAPNRYDPNYPGSIKSLLERRVSKRGPYDLFTGPRDNTTIKNHFSAPMSGAVDKFYPYSTDLDLLLSHSRKKWNGKFLREIRWPRKYTLRHLINDPVMCYKDPDDPAPGTYNLRKRKKLKKSLYPFNMSVKHVRPPIPQIMQPGVGRYNPKAGKCTLPGESYVFKSKLGREIFKVIEYNSF